MDRILLIENTDTFHDIRNSLLLRRGCIVHRVSKREEALKIIDNEKPDLILMDMTIHDLDPEEICLKAGCGSPDSECAVIAVTAPGDRSTPLKCLNSGCVDTFESPPESAEFYERVCSLLKTTIRRYFRTIVRIGVEIAGKSSLFFATSVNLSAGGILLECDQHFEPGSTIDLSFNLPGEEELIKASGVIARIADEVPDKVKGYGITFTEIRDEDRVRIDSFVQENLSS